PNLKAIHSALRGESGCDRKQDRAAVGRRIGAVGRERQAQRARTSEAKRNQKAFGELRIGKPPKTLALVDRGGAGGAFAGILVGGLADETRSDNGDDLILGSRRKHQIPNTKHQTSSKPQTSNLKLHSSRQCRLCRNE